MHLGTRIAVKTMSQDEKKQRGSFSLCGFIKDFSGRLSLGKATSFWMISHYLIK